MFVIINCDDFGMDEAVNQAVYQAHRAGRLYSTTLIMDWHALDGAIQIAKQCPNLGVGLHLDLDKFLGFDIDGYYGSTISNVNPERYAQVVQNLAEVTRHIEEQFTRFFSFGLSMSHVDSHHNAHLLPEIFQAVVRIAGKYKVRKMRFRRDFYEAQEETYQQHYRILQQNNFKIPSDFRDFGRAESIHHLNDGITEIMAHLRDPTYGDDWCVHQFNRLMSQESWDTLKAQDAQIISYRHV
jgi:predicted glycoside hydrolase/deacetylase ChbG (UPF0249 family)